MATVSQFRARNRRRTDQERESPAFLDDILSMVGGLANSRKEYAAAQLENLAQSVRQFTDAMPDVPTVRAYATTAAESLEQLADYVVESDLSEMVRDAGEFTRRHPVATFGGSIAAGVLLTQIMQSRVAGLRGAGRGTARTRRSSETTSSGVRLSRRGQGRTSRRTADPVVAEQRNEEI